MTYLSEVVLEEVDCGEMRTRQLQTTYFPQISMGGGGTTFTFPLKWTYEIPGTMGDGIAQFACKSR
jgi:hypothetical protein